MKRIILFMTVLCLVGACSSDTEEVINRADDAIFMLVSTNWASRVWNVGNGRTRVEGRKITLDDNMISIQAVTFNPKDIGILQKQKNVHYDALGDLLYMYSHPDTYNRDTFTSLWTNFGVNYK